MDIPESLKCPITHELLRDPVIGSDGHTYERQSIITWITKYATSPITREPMDINSLRSNYIVKKMVDEFVSSSLERQYIFRLDIDICKVKQQPIFKSSNKTIYEAKWLLKHGPSIVLIKIDGTKAKREASFYVKLSCHPHIVRTYGLVESQQADSVILVQEYAPEGDLSELLRSNDFHPTDNVLIEIFWQIVDAMICLADNQIIHGDLACRNVLVFRSNAIEPTEILVKLTDFGLTRVSQLFSIIDAPVSSTMTMIPIRYAAPELLLDTSSTINYSEKSDVYSFGVLMWEACSEGAVPYGHIKTAEYVFQEKLKGTLLERPSRCVDDLWNIIFNCTQQEPHKRPNFKSIRESLLQLRYEKKRNSSTNTSRINFNSQHITFSNVNPEYVNISAMNHLNPSSSEYCLSCDYCSQSVNTDEYDHHLQICPIRCLIKSFIKIFMHLPLIEISLCEICENLIPLNMLNIHRNICNGKSAKVLNTIEHQLWSNEFPSQSIPVDIKSTKTNKNSLHRMFAKIRKKIN